MSFVENAELGANVIGCLIEVLADDEGRIDPKCFEKICNACIKAVLIAAKVGDSAVTALKQSLVQVRSISSAQYALNRSASYFVYAAKMGADGGVFKRL